MSRKRFWGELISSEFSESDPNATVAVLIDSYDSNSSLNVRTKLQQMGFRIEAGVRCHQGLVLSACRQGFNQIEAAA